MRALSLLSGAALSVAVLAACDGGGTESPSLPEESPTPVEQTAATPEPTPTAVPADMESFRTFAEKVETAIEERDAEFFVASAKMSVVVCPNEFEPRCEGQPPETAIEGIWLGRWRSEGSLQTPDEMMGALAAYLNSLAEPSLHAIGLREGAGLVGERSFFAVVASSDEPGDSTYVFEFVPSDSAWRFASVMEAPVLADEWLSGECAECYDHWERWEGTP